MPEIGERTMYITAKSFVDKTEDKFIKSMSTNYPRVSDDLLDESQIGAWRDCYRVLQEMLNGLPKYWRKDFWMVFEYTLPIHAPWTKKFEKEKKHFRADVILLTKNKAIVLEFKQWGKPSKELYSQAAKYGRRLRRYHIGSQDMQISSILVLTKAAGFRETVDGVSGCSPDNLAEEVYHIIGSGKLKACNCNAWLNSGFIRERPEKD